MLYKCIGSGARKCAKHGHESCMATIDPPRCNHCHKRENIGLECHEDDEDSDGSRNSGGEDGLHDDSISYTESEQSAFSTPERLRKVKKTKTKQKTAQRNMPVTEDPTKVAASVKEEIVTMEMAGNDVKMKTMESFFASPTNEDKTTAKKSGEINASQVGDTSFAIGTGPNSDAPRGKRILSARKPGTSSSSKIKLLPPIKQNWSPIASSTRSAVKAKNLGN